MRAGPWLSNPTRYLDEKTIVQGEISHSLAVPAQMVATQNGLFGDCVWTQTESKVIYPSDYPAAVEVSLPKESFFPIVTGKGSKSTKPVPTTSTSTSEVRPPSPPACTV